MISSPRTAIAVAIAALASSSQVEAFSTAGHQSKQSQITSTVLHGTSNNNSQLTNDESRRSFLATLTTASLAAATTTLLSSQPALAAETKESLVADLSTSLTKIRTIPPLLEAAEWDKVRTVLKTQPVNGLWNLGESQNTLVKLAKETGEFDLMEMKDELAISLQMTDQYSYDNNFIYYQPGNGKLKTKEPLEMAKKAIIQLEEAVAAAEKI